MRSPDGLGSQCGASKPTLLRPRYGDVCVFNQVQSGQEAPDAAGAADAATKAATAMMARAAAAVIEAEKMKADSLERLAGLERQVRHHIHPHASHNPNSHRFQPHHHHPHDHHLTKTPSQRPIRCRRIARAPCERWGRRRRPSNQT